MALDPLFLVSLPLLPTSTPTGKSRDPSMASAPIERCSAPPGKRGLRWNLTKPPQLSREPACTESIDGDGAIPMLAEPILQGGTGGGA